MTNQRTEPTYTKRQFLSSKQYTALQKDMMGGLLSEQKTYTTEQVSEKLNLFKQMEAK